MRLGAAAVILGACLAVTPATAVATPAPGQTEEWATAALARTSQFEIADGGDGSAFYLQSSVYGSNFGVIERTRGPGNIHQYYLGVNAGAVDIVRGPDGDMWLTEPHHEYPEQEPDAIGRLDPEKDEKPTEFAITGTELEPADICCDGPMGIVSGPKGHLWFTDRHENMQHEVFIGEMSTIGALTQHPIPAGKAENRAVQPAPAGITTGREGDVWFTDDGTNTKGQNLVGRVTSAGAVEEFPIPSIGAEPAAITLGADGAIWFSEPGTRKIGRIDDSRTISEVPVPAISSALKGLALGPEGNLWFGEITPLPGFGSISPTGEVRSYHPEFPPQEGISEIVGPQSLVLGPESTLWFTDPRPRDELEPGPTYIGRFGIPMPPSITAPPAVFGKPQVASILSASGGIWANNPTSLTFQWQRCSESDASCVDVPGSGSPTYLASPSDVGQSLRVVVIASNAAGARTGVSQRTATVVYAPVPTVKSLPEQVKRLGVTITSSFRRAKQRVAVSAMTLHGVPRGALVRVSCRGDGCEFPRARTHSHAIVCKGGTCSDTERISPGGRVDLMAVTRRMRLRSGARLVVAVRLDGWIGRAFEFKIGSRGVPSPVITCRAPASFTLKASC